MFMPNKKINLPILSSLKTIKANNNKAQQEAGTSIILQI